MLPHYLVKLEMSVVSRSHHCTDLLRPVCRCAVLLEYEIVTDISLMHHAWQQLLLQQYFMIIVAVHFHSMLHNFIFQQAVHLRTGYVTQSHFYAERRQTSFLPTSGAETAQVCTPLIIRSGL